MGKNKMGWQMTRAEWDEVTRPLREVVSSAKGRTIFDAEIVDAISREQDALHRRVGDYNSNLRHDVQVAVALVRGWPVPAEVLAEYPAEHWLATYDLRHIASFVTPPDTGRV